MWLFCTKICDWILDTYLGLHTYDPKTIIAIDQQVFLKTSKKSLSDVKFDAEFESDVTFRLEVSEARLEVNILYRKCPKSSSL